MPPARPLSPSTYTFEQLLDDFQTGSSLFDVGADHISVTAAFIEELEQNSDWCEHVEDGLVDDGVTLINEVDHVVECTSCALPFPDSRIGPAEPEDGECTHCGHSGRIERVVVTVGNSRTRLFWGWWCETCRSAESLT